MRPRTSSANERSTLKNSFTQWKRPPSVEAVAEFSGILEFINGAKVSNALRNLHRSKADWVDEIQLEAIHMFWK